MSMILDATESLVDRDRLAALAYYKVSQQWRWCIEPTHCWDSQSASTLSQPTIVMFAQWMAAAAELCPMCVALVVCNLPLAG